MSVTRNTVRNGLFPFAFRATETAGGRSSAGVGRHLLAAAALLGMAAVGSGLSAAEALAAKAAAIVVDARTGQVLIDQDADAIVHPASLTKMMTLYLAFDALEDGRLSLDQQLPVSAFAQSMSPTKLGLRAGQTLKVETAILGLVTKSANDAAVVLAEALGGTEARFAEMMTRKARELGMRRTVYRNASGLPNMEQVTTARDYAVLSRALMRDHAKYYPYFSRRNFVYGGRTMANHNNLMSRYEGMDGIKTGYTIASGFNLAASAVRDGRRLVGVVMGGKSAGSRDNKMAALLDQAFSRASQGRDEGPVMASLDTRSDAVTGEVGDVKAKPVRAAVQMAAIPAAPARESKPARETGSHWGVQVGAFSSRAAGNKAVTQAVKQAPFILRAAKPSVVEAKAGKDTIYRARLTGLDEKDARKACAVLTKHGHHCVAVSPAERG